ncbi:hypothetical protein D9M68_745720 [compost metagenome]
MKNVAEFKQQDPAAVMKAMGINVDKAMRVAEAAGNDPLQRPAPGVGFSPRKAVKGKAAAEPELEMQSAPGFARGR